MNRFVLGIVLILLGVGLYWNQGHPIGAGTIFSYYWPSLFVIPLGLFFHWLYFSITAPRASGLLIPGGVLLTAGIVCQISMLFDSWGFMWPGFLLAPAIGLFEFYWFGLRNRYLLIPITILTGLSILFFAAFTLGAIFNYLVVSGPVIAIALVVIGAFTLLGGKSKA
ncbi:hypothetical protein O9H85_05150 [Paenibacillus filicis]|uniref:DUF5668 domain-containing protein n=1 Tax=Paenibacillus gyeongsangnamensis TaxID=3388067 RepID=A0ABT4Q4M6_9BACL|nr:hypothetical protein [Paenibacillus filicis]MCZ8511817.1 hypothetical protein [Paenibacillus filicis]